MRNLLVAAVLALPCAAAVAQLRTIPPEATRAAMRHVEGMLVEVDGKPEQFAPGAQIRDADNRIIVPVSLPANSVVKYLRGADGQIYRVWILTPEEARQE